ncbi:Uncharacterised protein [Halioglobus japonicus]|nr:Uncharacterised protein [Halioglobus japonicus]
MMLNSFRLLSTVTLIGLLSGCFLEVIVPKGGSVVSVSQVNDCAEGSNCSIEISDANFTDAFTAIPNDGYEFVKWMGGSEFLCRDSTSTTCIVSNTALASNASTTSIIAGDDTFYIMPVFKRLPFDPLADDDGDTILNIDDVCPETPLGWPVNAYGCPIELIFTPDGRKWAQLDHFNGLSYSEIAAACPDGVCSGTLNGYDMAGWIWASSQDVLDMWNSYYPTGFLLTPVPHQTFASPTLIQALKASGFNFVEIKNSIGFGIYQLGGYTSDPEETSFAHLSDVSWVFSDGVAIEIGVSPSGFSGDDEGAWFYRE